MMKLPIQVAPVKRGNSTVRHATNSGIKPSEENLCSCKWEGSLWSGGCVLNWNKCPEGTYPQCRWSVTCRCDCCNQGGCYGNYP